MLVLGLETSCDETGVALYDSERGLLADALFSQIDLHRAYGGVVPELASRDHVKRMLPLIRQVLEEAGRTAQDIDAIAYTAGRLTGGERLAAELSADPHQLPRGADRHTADPATTGLATTRRPAAHECAVRVDCLAPPRQFTRPVRRARTAFLTDQPAARS